MRSGSSTQNFVFVELQQSNVAKIINLYMLKKVSLRIFKTHKGHNNCEINVFSLYLCSCYNNNKIKKHQRVQILLFGKTWEGKGKNKKTNAKTTQPEPTSS